MSESLVFLGREESSGGFFGKVSHQMDTLMIMGDRHSVTNPLWLKLKPDKVGVSGVGLVTKLICLSYFLNVAISPLPLIKFLKGSRSLENYDFR